MSNDRDWIETFKIQQLIYRYSDSVNRGDLEAMRSVYADDALWESPLLGFRHESADAFVEFFRVNTVTTELLIQTPHCPVVELLGTESARATTTIYEITKGTALEAGPLGPAGAALNYSNFGIYYDELSRIDDEWKFTHRLFVPIYMEPGSVTGDVMTARSELLNPRVS